jgi:hypothetical protein
MKVRHRAARRVADQMTPMQHGRMLVLRTELLRRKLDELYGGNVAKLAREMSPERNRSTVTRWLRRGSRVYPKNEEAALALAAALNVDPMALWDVHPGAFGKLAALVENALRSGRWGGLLPPMKYLRGFVGPVGDWPPGEIAQAYERTWRNAGFVHSAEERRNYYASVELTRTDASVDPQVWHFAYRATVPAADRRPWRPYGFVELCGEELRLFSFGGIDQRLPVSGGTARVAVETWFGEGPAEFRVASLHRFGLHLVHQPSLDGVPRVRFGFPAPPPAA